MYRSPPSRNWAKFHSLIKSPLLACTKTKTPTPSDHPHRVYTIPTNFFWDISVRFLSWECWDFWRRHNHFQRFPKKSEDFRRRLKSSKDVRSLPKAKLSSPSLRTRINASSLSVLFTSKIRDREEGIVIYSFYTWFWFLSWIWVNIFFEIVSSKTATTHVFQSGVRNWPASVSWREIKVFNP